MNEGNQKNTPYEYNQHSFGLSSGPRQEIKMAIPFNDNLLHDYLMMLNKDNNRDIHIFAIQSLEGMINDAMGRIVNDSERFMAMFNLTEMFTMPYEIQES